MGRTTLITLLCLALVGCTASPGRFAECKDAELLLLPHHLVVEEYINDMYEAVGRPQKLVIVSPDHFSQGKQNISPAAPMEHGATVHETLAAEYWPKATVESWMIKVNTPVEELEAFASKLFKEDALILFSVDFSHYLPGTLARVHDLRTREILETADIGSVLNVEVDSPPTLYVMLKLLELRGEAIQILLNTNPSWDVQIETAENTTHMFGCNAESEVRSRQLHTAAYFAKPHQWYLGKSMEDRALYGYDEVHFNQGGSDYATVTYTNGGTESVAIHLYEGL